MPFVYPAPNWSDRVYVWGIMKDPNVSGAIGVAAACTVILMALFVTVIVKVT